MLSHWAFAHPAFAHVAFAHLALAHLALAPLALAHLAFAPFAFVPAAVVLIWSALTGASLERPLAVWGLCPGVIYGCVSDYFNQGFK